MCVTFEASGDESGGSCDLPRQKEKRKEWKKRRMKGGNESRQRGRKVEGMKGGRKEARKQGGRRIFCRTPLQEGK